jgi:hypothetical protein
MIDRITTLGNAIFTGPPDRQVVNEQWFPPDQLFAISDVETATRALQIITQQGEGTRTSPLDLEGGLAHYYLVNDQHRRSEVDLRASVQPTFSIPDAECRPTLLVSANCRSTVLRHNAPLSFLLQLDLHRTALGSVSKTNGAYNNRSRLLNYWSRI